MIRGSGKVERVDESESVSVKGECSYDNAKDDLSILMSGYIDINIEEIVTELCEDAKESL